MTQAEAVELSLLRKSVAELRLHSASLETQREAEQGVKSKASDWFRPLD